jgi:hypothetical protein
MEGVGDLLPGKPTEGDAVGVGEALGEGERVAPGAKKEGHTVTKPDRLTVTQPVAHSQCHARGSRWDAGNATQTMPLMHTKLQCHN